MYEKYAELLLKRCLNIKEGEPLLINAPIECIEFIRIVAKEAYKLGVNDIYFDLTDDILKRDQLENLDINIKSDLVIKSISSTQNSVEVLDDKE